MSNFLRIPKSNASPLKSYRDPIGKACLPTTIFHGPLDDQYIFDARKKFQTYYPKYEGWWWWWWWRWRIPWVLKKPCKNHQLNKSKFWGGGALSFFFPPTIPTCSNLTSRTSNSMADNQIFTSWTFFRWRGWHPGGFLGSTSKGVG